MKKMNMKLASLLLFAILTAACAPQICFAADTPAFTAADIVNQLQTPIPAHSDGITQTTSYYGGIAFTWHGEGKPTKIGEYQLTWSDGAYGSLPGTVQPAVAFGEIVGHLDETGFPWNIKITNTISDELKSVPEIVYMINACDSETVIEDMGTRTVCTYDGIADALMNDPNVEVQGLILVSEKMPLSADGYAMDWVSRDYLTELVPITTNRGSGDVDGNGSVDLGDALTALQTYSDVELMNQPNPLTATQFIAADMDGDGKVTIGDALAILQTYTDETLFHQ